jgi:RNA polymerase sigma factor (TIGR02999 family)
MADADITALLERWGGGDETAFERLVPLVYDDLRRIARNYMRRENADHTLQSTAVVHEAVMRMAEHPFNGWQSRSHFFGVAARLMRRVLVDHARRNLTAKRGGYIERTAFDDAIAIPAEIQQEMLDVDRALERFAEIDPDSARIVEMRYFAGMSVEEVAEATSRSTATVKRASLAARSWLHREIAGLQ